jgi:hypothetical protein
MATRQRTIAALLLTALTATGCASASQRYVTFPSQGQDAAKQSFDSNECELIAQGKKEDPLTAAAAGGLTRGLIGGAAGAAGGAILGAMFSSAGKGAQAGLIGLGIGAVLGVVEGVAANHARYQDIWKACMDARGYKSGG